MAIDLKREVSFDLKKKRDDPEKAYPTKRSMNLYRIEHPEVDKRKVGALVAILVVALGLFVRFGVAGPLMEIRDKEAELARVQGELAPITERAAEYERVRAEYEKYSLVSGTSGVDASSVLDMIESQVMPSATVSQVTLEDTKLTLTLSNVSLDTVGVIANNVSAQPNVSDVAVSTAQTASDDGSSQVVATITVTLTGSSASSGTNSSAKGGA